MALLSDGEFIADAWRRVTDEEALPGEGHCIVSLARLPEAAATLPPSAPLGVLLPNTTEPGALAPFLKRLALIAVAFPAFNDGRGFSLARLIRRAGFSGELRASGRLVADQVGHARRCGFDTIELASDIAHRQEAAQWRAAFASYSEFYQQGYGAGPTILERRRAAR